MNPATAEVLTDVADADERDARTALQAAERAQPSWARTPARTRSEILYRAHQLMIERTEQLALLMTLEMGKPLPQARGEVAYAAEFFRWFAEEAVRVDGGYAHRPDGAARNLQVKQPVGPSLLIIPWNFPLAMGARKLGPAIAAGCVSILKPAPQTPLCSLALAQILADAGLPEGVLSVVTTSRAADVVPLILGSGVIRKLSFTGSTEVGKLLLEQAAREVLRTSMELGGNAPFLVLAGRRPGPCGAGRIRRQDAEHGRGVHGRQPLLRPRRRGRGVLRAARRAYGRPDRRGWHARTASTSDRSSTSPAARRCAPCSTTPCNGARRSWSAAAHRRGPVTSWSRRY